MSVDCNLTPEDVRKRALVLITVLLTVSFALVGSGSVAVAGSETPGEPASFFGSAVDEDGVEIPTGVSVVAVADGEVVGEIEIETDGEYGGRGAFDDKLRVDSSAGEKITFRLADAAGPAADTVDLAPGVFETGLVFPSGAVEYVRPEAVADISPTPAAPNETVRFSATGSSAHERTEIAAFRWTVEHEGNEIATFEGEMVDRYSEVEGEYSVELEVIDSTGRAETTTETFEIDSAAIEEDNTEQSGGGDATSGGGSTASGGSSAGGGGRSLSDDGPTDGSAEPEETDGIDDDEAVSERSRNERGVEPIADETVQIDDVFPDAAGTTVILDETSVREIVFTNGSASGDISVEEFDEITDGTPSLSEDLQIVSASVIDVPTALVDDAAVIRAIVDSEWLQARGLAPDQLTVYRFPSGGDQWQELPTEAFEVEQGVIVEAETPGFSQFVIAGPEGPEQSGAEPTAGDESDSMNAIGTAPDVGASSVLAQGLSSQADDTGMFRAVSLVLALVSLLAIVWIGGRVFIPKRRDRWMP